MNHLKKYSRTLSTLTFFAILAPGLISLAAYVILREAVGMDAFVAAILVAASFIILSFLSYLSLIALSLQPLEKVWQAIWHISPDKSGVPSPNLKNVKLGREMVSAMIMQVYDLASNGHAVRTEASSPAVADTGSLVESIPLSLFVLNKERVITTANAAACTYLGLSREKIIGKNVYDVLHMSFSTNDTLDSWLGEIADKRATDTRSWEHIRLNLENGAIRQFDMAASFSKDNSSGNEIILALFDRNDSYNKQDQATSYVALAVHELRTPLTILRGYIEVFEDEIGDQLTPELQEFMRKMSAAAQTLTAFVSNILNVARIDENQFVLNLHEANWSQVLPEIIKDLEIRAGVRGKKIELDIEPDLPTVAIDKISMYEVVSNLVDNAIKYSGQSHRIVVHAHKAQDGTIETVVEDFGVGMPPSALNDLFTKYYRSHRSKRAVSGSGLGLYLVKSIVTAHGGNVSVNSKEGEGSRFGFTLQPYSSVSSQPNAQSQDGIERQASGWIKNHSLYRR